MTGPTLRHVLGTLGLAALDDRRLLERFRAARDEAAFEALVRRHGPLVLGVCRRLLRHEHDAEDAFQATFLVLARRADAVARPEALASWLYGVALRVATRARGVAERRRSREGALGDPAAPPTPAFDGLGEVLDEEIGRLPESYRLPLLLCELQGQPRRAAAEQLGLPEGTLSSRLARGRDLLRRRLTTRGVALGAAALTLALARAATASPLPPTLPAGGAVPPRVAALAHEALRASCLGGLKGALAVVLAASLLGVGAVSTGGGTPPSPAESTLLLTVATPAPIDEPVAPQAAPPDDDDLDEMAVEPPAPHDEPPAVTPPTPRAPNRIDKAPHCSHRRGPASWRRAGP